MKFKIPQYHSTNLESIIEILKSNEINAGCSCASYSRSKQYGDYCIKFMQEVSFRFFIYYYWELFLSKIITYRDNHAFYTELYFYSFDKNIDCSEKLNKFVVFKNEK